MRAEKRFGFHDNCINLLWLLIKESIGMQAKIGWMVFCFLILSSFDCLWSGANPVRAEEYRYKIDFGKARPVESLVLDRNLSIKTNPGENRIKVDFDSALSNHNGDHISINRLNLSINDRNFELDRGPFEVDSQTDDKLFLTFSLKLTPADHPGDYQGTVSIETPLKKISFQLEVEVEPWVRMETDRFLIRMDQVTKEDFKLRSAVPLTIRLASNTKWVLSVNSTQKSKVPLQLKLERQRGNNAIQDLFQSGGHLETDKKALAAGISTVSPSESYWSEIDLVVYIDDFNKYPAGEELFQLRFLLELWDKKTVNL